MTTLTKLTSDFDFLTGHFDVVHRQLKEPLTGSDEWVEYAGSCTARTHFEGAVSIDEARLPTMGSYGMSIRVFDPVEKQWTIYWVSSRDGKLQPPVRGRWVNGSCRLVGEDEHQGRPVLVQFTWSDITEQGARWEQAYSVDGGETWETNWTMQLSRRSTEPAALDIPKATGDFDFFVGHWDVHHRRLAAPLTGSDDWYELPGTSDGYTLFGGAISVDETGFPTEGFHGLTIRLYDSEARTWSIYWTNSRRGVLEPPVHGGFDAEGIGLFHGSDQHEGRPVDVRFRWTRATAPVWEQFFSVDEGRTWEPNWTMTFTRISE
ncbi:MAG TPA: hypothetical protein VFT31_00080 [Kribbella sp.]|nr:hypothetical protein [Kribbella sp.]